MSKKTLNVVITIGLFVVLLGGAWFAYNRYTVSQQIAVPPMEAAVTAVPAEESQTTGNTVVPDAEQTPAPTKEASNLKKAPDFTLETLDGRTVSLSDYEGKKAVVLNFWASWCPPCRAEMPDFSKAAAQLGEDKLVFLMVNLTDGQRETKEAAQQYLKDEKLTFNNVLLDTKFEASDAYAVSGIPATYFINKDGTIAKSYVGSITESKLQDGIALITK